MSKIITQQTQIAPILIKDIGRLYPTEKSKQKARYGIYKCECGIEFKARTNDIKSGNTTSCGCYQKQMVIEANLRRTTHGMAGHRLYHTWTNMINRTTNQKYTKFKDYGGRGIKVCEEWLDINNFIDDMYPSYSEGLSIDRIDNNGNYEPNNCRWATKTTQHRNTRILRSTNTSGYRGVIFNKAINKWQAEIVAGMRIYLGSFTTALEAAKAYDTYVMENNLEHTVNGVM